MKDNKFFSKYFFIALGISTYPVTVLYTSNYENTSLVMYLIPLVFVYFCTSFFYFVFFLVNKKYPINNIYLCASIISMVFFLYGSFNEQLINHDNSLISMFGGHRFLFPLILGCLVLIIYFIKDLDYRSKKYRFILLYFILINTLPFFQLSYYLYSSESKYSKKELVFDNSMRKNKLPNVYYIILDGYGSSTTMKKLFDFDNFNFNSNLEKIGFKVQNNASSNYCRTNFSLSSTLNVNYIQNIVKKDIYQSDLNMYLSNNIVSETFKKNGYTYYLFDSGFGLKNKYDSKDILVSTDNIFFSKLFTTSDNDILGAFIKNSIFKVFQSNFFTNISVKNYSFKVLNVFEKLPKIAKNDDKKFVFAHIICPHPPFLFNEFGKISEYGIDDPNKAWDSKLYISQLKFINKEVINLINQIIINDVNDKIIIIQGDHGSRILSESSKLNNSEKWVLERYSILNAIYLSDNLKYKSDLYKNWNYSSVNTFRLIFNNIFNSKLELLPDKKNYSNLNEPYNFKIIQ